MMVEGWPFDLYTSRSNLHPMHLYGEKVEMSFSKMATQGLQFCSNDGRRLTFDLFMARSDLRPHTFVWGKC